MVKKENNMTTTMQEWTGERYLPTLDPETSGAEIHYEHLHRYAFASRFSKGKKVLDLGSGEGYGCNLLANEAESVIGVDANTKAIHQAKKTYPRRNLSFIQGSVTDLPIKDNGAFDLIICYETIEHVEEHQAVMREVKRLLKEDGLFIISSPNKKVYSDLPERSNPFHKKELYFNEFRKLLDDHFPCVILLGQKVICGSFICEIRGRNENLCTNYAIIKGDAGIEFTTHSCDDPLYYIAVATKSSLKGIQSLESVLIDNSDLLIRQKLSLESRLARLMADTQELEWHYITCKHELQQISHHPVWNLYQSIVHTFAPIGSKQRRIAYKVLSMLHGSSSKPPSLSKQKITYIDIPDDV